MYQGLGAVDEFLTAAPTGRLQVIYSTIEPGGGTGDEAYTHDSDEEVVVVLEGSLDLWVGPSTTASREGTRSRIRPASAAPQHQSRRRRPRPVLHHPAQLLSTRPPDAART